MIPVRSLPARHRTLRIQRRATRGCMAATSARPPAAPASIHDQCRHYMNSPIRWMPEAGRSAHVTTRRETIRRARARAVDPHKGEYGTRYGTSEQCSEVLSGASSRRVVEAQSIGPPQGSTSARLFFPAPAAERRLEDRLPPRSGSRPSVPPSWPGRRAGCTTEDPLAQCARPAPGQQARPALCGRTGPCEASVFRIPAAASSGAGRRVGWRTLQRPRARPVRPFSAQRDAGAGGRPAGVEGEVIMCSRTTAHDQGRFLSARRVLAAGADLPQPQSNLTLMA